MRDLRASNNHLGDAPALRESLDAEGYVFFRQVIDGELVRHVKRGVMAWFEAQGAIEIIDDEPIYRTDAPPLDDYPPGLYETRLWEWFAMRREIRDFFTSVFGKPNHVLPIGEYQHTRPNKPDCWTRVHQDGPFFNHQEGPWGAGLDFLVFWFPLMAIEEAAGGLAIVPSPRARGSLHHGLEKDAAARFIAVESFPDDAWYRTDYQPGDALVFGPFTPHCGMPNESDRLRLSIDLRVEPTSPGRQITGVVMCADVDRVVICADSGEELTLTLDDRTAIRLPHSTAGRHHPKLLVGQRVVVTAREGRAIAVRQGYGYLPWDQ